MVPELLSPFASKQPKMSGDGSAFNISEQLVSEMSLLEISWCHWRWNKTWRNFSGDIPVCGMWQGGAAIEGLGLLWCTLSGPSAWLSLLIFFTPQRLMLLNSCWINIPGVCYYFKLGLEGDKILSTTLYFKNTCLQIFYSVSESSNTIYTSNVL